MNLAGPLYLGGQYLWQHRWRSLLVTLTISLGMSLPAGIWLGVDRAEAHLRERAGSTPLLLGANGSPLELVFNGLYFSEPDIEAMTLRDAEQAAGDGLAHSIPIYARYQAQGHPIVGTTIDYFDFRGLRFAQGHAFTRLGDCVIGAGVARQLGLEPGDALVSSPERVFDLTGVYPLKMRVTGVLEPSGTPDDRAVFADLKTTWVIEGLAHGHQDAKRLDTAVLEQQGTHTALNASITEYTQITDDNIDSFHFHGDVSGFPITAAIVVPQDAKAQTILLGRYVGESRTHQLIRPDTQMANLFGTVFRVRAWVAGMLAAVGCSSFLIVALVLVLSHRLRAGEFVSLRVIGASPGVIRAMVLFEAGVILTASALLTAGALLTLWLLTPVVLTWAV
ncbi:MAG: ABC transporter permease [Phycisphaeraceae bacterium]